MWVCLSPVECQCLVCGAGACSECRYLPTVNIYFPNNFYLCWAHWGGWGGSGLPRWGEGVFSFPNLSGYKIPVNAWGAGVEGFFPSQK